MIVQVIRAVASAVVLPLCCIFLPALLTTYLLFKLDQPGPALTAALLPLTVPISIVLHEVGHIVALGSASRTAVVRTSSMRVTLEYTSVGPFRTLISAASGPALPAMVGVAMLFSSVPLLQTCAPAFLVNLIALAPPSHDGTTIWTACKSLLAKGD